MKSLFLRIFLWFWLVMAVVVGLLVGLSPAWTRVRPAFARWEQRAFARLAHETEQAGRLLSEQGPEQLQHEFQQFGRGPSAHLFVLDHQGQDLFGQPVPSRIGELARRSLESGQVELERDGPQFFAARPVVGGAGERRVVAIVQGPSRSGPRHGPPRPIELLEPRALVPLLGLIVLVVGGLSFWLARYLTAPVSVLRRATRGLSGGDLSTRVGGAVASRRDELGDLARDFDAMAERLESLVGSQRRLLRDVSHELRSPLARLLVALELARDRAGERAVEPLDRIARETDRLNALIGQLLALQRLEFGTGLTQVDEVDVGELLEEVANDAEFEARSRSCHVRVEKGPPCVVSGARELLRSAIENVVRNAVSYSPDGTDVEIAHRLNAHGGTSRVSISVRDRGPGVPDQDLGHLFEPFYRVAHARDRQSGGTGLGLAITDRAVTLHGGSVTARNHPDGGLVVELTLPSFDDPDSVRR
jgi:two-component system sensor histidine kinase CpxA